MEYIKLRELEIVNLVDKRMEMLSIKYPKQFICLTPIDNKNKLPIYSLQFPGYHYNIIVKLLNDLFGINTRGGVSCTFYGEVLLGIKYKPDIIPKFGWVRVSFIYYMKNDVIEYVLNSIEYLISNIQNHIGDYLYDESTNKWEKKDNTKQIKFMKLKDMI